MRRPETETAEQAAQTAARWIALVSVDRELGCLVGCPWCFRDCGITWPDSLWDRICVRHGALLIAQAREHTQRERRERRDTVTDAIGILPMLFRRIF